MSRPRKEIDWKIFDALCKVRCTLEEIAAYFDCSEDTIERAVKREHRLSFADYHEQKMAVGLTSLRRKQWQLALKGHVTMLIWLGKQYLGQKDRSDVTTADQPIKDVEITHRIIDPLRPDA